VDMLKLILTYLPIVSKRLVADL